MKQGFLLLVVFILSIESGFANAGASDWFYGRSWEFIESVGGIAINTPSRVRNCAVFLPVTCDVSGLKSVTKKPTSMNSSLVVTDIDKKIEGNEILLSVKTGLASKLKTSACSGVELGDIPAGDYQVFYLGPDRQKHSLGKVIVPQN